MIAPAGQLTLQELARVLRQERISTLWLTAGLFHTMVENELEALAGVRQVLAGGMCSRHPMCRGYWMRFRLAMS